MLAIAIIASTAPSNQQVNTTGTPRLPVSINKDKHRTPAVTSFLKFCDQSLLDTTTTDIGVSLNAFLVIVIEAVDGVRNRRGRERLRSLLPGDLRYIRR